MTEMEKYLKKSLLFQMSLGSKELFHSNVWAWLIEMDKNFISVFFNDFDIAEYNSISVSREAHNRDIIIWLTDKTNQECYFVIENKIKSLPSVGQLEKYSEDLENCELKMAVFTGIINPFGSDAVEISGKRRITWSFVSYRKIADRIRALLIRSTKLSEGDIAIAYEYCKIVNYLNDILYEKIDQNANKLIYDNAEELKDLRIYDIYAKMRGAKFMQYVESRREEFADLSDRGFKLVLAQSFHNGSATLDIRYSNWKEGCASWFLLGIQIEEYQYRFVAECNNENYGGGKSFDELYDEMIACGWLDGTYAGRGDMVFGKPTRMNPRKGKKYNSYKNKDNSMSFIYQYYDLGGDDTYFETLFETIKEHMSRAAAIICNKNS